LILFALLLVSCKTSVTPLPTQDLTSGISQASSEAASEAVSETTSDATSAAGSSSLSATSTQEPVPTVTKPPSNKTEFSLEEKSTIISLLNVAGKVVPLGTEKDEIVGQPTTEEKGDFRYTYEKHDVVDNVDSIVYLGLNDDVIWPGSLVKGTQAQDFVYVPISVDRAPITLSISLEGATTGTSITKVVNDPRLSTVRQGISDLLKSAIVGSTRVPAKVEFKYAQVYSESQLSLAVGADVSYGAGSLKTKFNWDSTTKKNKIIASYRQIYYSIDMDTPKSAYEIFAPSMSLDEIESAIQSGSMPLYVSSVSYGMMAFVFIETDYSYEEMKSALDAAYKSTVSGSIDLDINTKTILQNSSIQTVVYGGSTAGLNDLESGYNGFLNVIKASKDFNSSSPGVPLIYRFRHVSDNTLALITLTSQYTLVRPLRLRQRVRVTVERFVCTLSDDEGVNNNADMDRLYVWSTAYNRNSTAETGAMIGTENQQVFGWATSSDWSVGTGGIFDATKFNNKIEYIFDTEHYSFNKAVLKLKAYAREYDTTSSNEAATVFYEIVGEDFMDEGGKHVFQISDSSDFGFDVHITIELLTTD
ncbi:MAG: thiol-activated cytolysin family protein, partial [Saccharofermentanales bacterium]